MTDSPAIEVFHPWEELKTSIAWRDAGGLFLGMWQGRLGARALINALGSEMADRLHVTIDVATMAMKDFAFFFNFTFQEYGALPVIIHVVGLDSLQGEAWELVTNSLQMRREELDKQPYHMIFWIPEAFEGTLFRKAPDFMHWIHDKYVFDAVPETENSATSQDVYRAAQQYFEKILWAYEHWQEVKNDENRDFTLDIMAHADLANDYISAKGKDSTGTVCGLDELADSFQTNQSGHMAVLLAHGGMGKTSFLLQYYMQQIKRWLANPAQERLPLFLSLKDHSGAFQVHDLIKDAFFIRFGLPINYTLFQELAKGGRLLILVDDDRLQSADNLREIRKLTFEGVNFMASGGRSIKGNKVLLASRSVNLEYLEEKRRILAQEKPVFLRNYAIKEKRPLESVFSIEPFTADMIENLIQAYSQKHSMGSPL